MGTIFCLYNTDYDEELTAISGVDVSAVEESARSVTQGIVDSGRQCTLVGVHGKKDMLNVLSRIEKESPDLIFNLVESLNGTTQHEALMPYLYELFGFAYTGPSGQSISMCLHKDQSKDILLRKGINTPPSLVLESVESLDDSAFESKCADIGYPLFLKLSREDASIGISEANRCLNWTNLKNRASELLTKYKQPVLCEAYIEGREVNVMLLGNGQDLEVLPLHEIDFAAMPDDRPKIISYAAKWDEDHVDYEGTKPVPMKNVSDSLQKSIEDIAKQTFSALDLRDYGRVDLRIDQHNIPWVIDVNPNCDISPDAGAARCARAHGLDYPGFVGQICDMALRRQRGPGKNL